MFGYNSSDGFQKCFWKNFTWSFSTSTPSFCNKACIMPGEGKAFLPLSSPFRFTTRWAGTPCEKELLFSAQPTIRAEPKER